MAKELPYFKFEPGIWDTGNIQLCTHEAKGMFIDICSIYWQRTGDLPYKLALQKACNGNATALTSLVDEGMVKVIEGMICIDFLNEQLSEFETISNTNSENARSGWEKRRKNATASQPLSDPNAIREEKKREEEKKKDEKKEEIVVAATPATIEQREKIFMDRVAEAIDIYPKEMLRAFFDYWTERNEGGRKMRFEMERVFDLSKRLKTWSNRQKPNGKQQTGENRKQSADRATATAIFETYRDVFTGGSNGQGSGPAS